MRLALDVAPVRAEPAGVGVYTASLARALARRSPANVALIGARDEAAAIADAMRVLPAMPFRAGPWERTPLAPNYHAWLQRSADHDARATGANLVHYTNSAAPVRSSLPFVVTVHDLSLMRLPHHHPVLRLATLPITLAAIARARAVVVPSDWVRGELIRGLRVSARRVVAIEHAASDLTVAADPDAVLARLGIGTRAYLLSVGTIEPRKNFARLVAAFEVVAQDDPALMLVLSGAPGWRRSAIERRIAASPQSDRIVVTGYLPDSDIAALMQRALVFCYVSIYEGYGLPVIEALAAGAPVVTSNRSAMPQAAGGAAVLVDPFDVADIVRGIREAILRRAELASAGPARAARRSWDDVAEEHLGVYDWALRQ